MGNMPEEFWYGNTNFKEQSTENIRTIEELLKLNEPFNSLPLSDVFKQ